MADANSIIDNKRPIFGGNLLLPVHDSRDHSGNYVMDDTKWRELCQRIMAEKDPEKLWALVEQLNEALQKREEQLRDREPGT